MNDKKSIRRGKLDIRFEILEKMRKGSKKTDMMNGTGTSFTQFQKYVKELEEYGYIQSKNDGNGFKVLGKGEEFLRDYKAFKEKYPD